MKLSILIPVYNAELYIGRCLDSLLNQNISKQDYEIIVFNDGSTDKSGEIVGDYSKKHYNIFLHSHENQGVIATRNKLLKLAKGDYLYFVDADDYVTHNSLGTQLDYAIAHNLDLMGFNALETSDEALYDLDTSQGEMKYSSIVSGNQFLKENKGIRYEIWWYFIRKGFLEAAEINFKQSDYDGDVDFTLALFLNAKRVAFCPITIYIYFQSPESTMRGNNLAYKKRIVTYFFALIIDFSNLINDLEKSSIQYKEDICSNFRFRRDAFTFFTIIKMIKAQYSLRTFKEKISILESVRAYPINEFIGKEYSSLKYKILAKVVNNKFILFTTIKLINLFVR
ncbi:glycosyltransferase [Flavivirga abyssicola]|uniref:glycosyltransferase n=1 Tax=Flavivirga abyssicola TaxID=3063533 RepID=UPI0026DEBAD2|nr:glycosyltransferase [Flavivirga sp. MEBiC07777]WVK13049.1 glycosyltransferase [Flavivirga sp. MEBiC07777]